MLRAMLAIPAGHCFCEVFDDDVKPTPANSSNHSKPVPFLEFFVDQPCKECTISQCQQDPTYYYCPFKSCTTKALWYEQMIPQSPLCAASHCVDTGLPSGLASLPSVLASMTLNRPPDCMCCPIPVRAFVCVCACLHLQPVPRSDNHCTTNNNNGTTQPGSHHHRWPCAIH